jgi:hypothetical protein
MRRITVSSCAPLLAVAVLSFGCSGGRMEDPAPEDTAAARAPLVLSSSMKLDVGQLPAVTNTWITVTLPSSYASMVVVATPAYGASSPPLVTRVRNTLASSFEVRVDRFDGLTGAVPAVPVHYLVVDAGKYTVAANGIKMEAVRFTSTVTDHKSSWNGTTRSTLNSYTAPVVLGQVLTYADARPSVFWSRGSSSGIAPSATSLRVGKHVGEDPVTSRANETVGYLVVEAGSGSLGGTAWQATLGSNIVQGVVDAAPASYALGTPGPSTVAVLSQAGMRGGDGSWALLGGPTASTGSSLRVSVDEDNAKDTERSHGAEQVAFFAVNQCPSAASQGHACGKGGACLANGTCCPDADGDGVCDATDACPGSDDRIDTDHDGKPNACDVCPLDSPDDSDGDTVCNSADQCPGSDDRIDTDHDGKPNACDVCPLDSPDDSDGDTVCNSADQCPGSDDRIDTDHDGKPNACDVCPLDSPDDSDGDTVCDSVDKCPGSDDRVDADADGQPDACDLCPRDNPNDSDGDAVCNSRDLCPGFDDHVDADGDGTPNGCDRCPGSDDRIDTDGDGIPNGCERSRTCQPGLTGPGVLDGSYLIDDTNTARDFAGLAGIWCVTGILNISGTTLTDLQPLSALEAVGGALNIGAYYASGIPNLTSLAGLQKLESVGSLLIARAPKLANFSALDHLDRIVSNVSLSGPFQGSDFSFLTGITDLQGGLFIADLPGLTSLSALAQLRTVGTDVNISRTGIINLHGLEGLSRAGLVLMGNSQLATLEGAENLVVSSLMLRQEPLLTSLAPLHPAGAVRALILSGLGLTNLEELHGVTEVQSFFELDQLPHLTSLSGLDGITGAGTDGFYAQITNNDVLESLTGLEHLTTVGGSLTLSSNASLASIAALGNLTQIGGDLTIDNDTPLQTLDGLSSLGSVGGNLEIYTPNLTSLAALSGLHSVGGWVEVGGQSLASLQGLQNVTTVGRGVSVNDTAVTDLSGFPAVSDVIGVNIINNRFLTALTGAESLRTIQGDLTFDGNPVLASLSALSQLNAVNGTLAVRDAPLVTDLAWMQATTFVGGLWLRNTGLTTLSGLPAVPYLGALQLEFNSALTALTGAEGLTYLGSVSFAGNPLLRTLAPLSNVVHATSLNVWNNASLTSLGLDSLSFINWGFYIHENALLPQCQVAALELQINQECSYCTGNDDAGVCE